MELFAAGDEVSLTRAPWGPSVQARALALAVPVKRWITDTLAFVIMTIS